ncbi:NWD2 [Coprinopsis cinerea okayama7|uniref:NWD2 n=1 Tax=Coprinopsis cinerea (strain Okayama-7 / 130 / ATCC MYA-4618 / FGSC 9003) TaxID=240176 RepID=A8P253_COPC7|nr:NWD2 [Coprinopsis cinerea okayama7\|eukprot:XP_001838248.1 NWD2 [Coprinopsis cinerea okayama7\
MPIFERAQNLVINGGTFNDFSSSNGIEPLAYLEHYAASGATYDSAERYPPPRCHESTRVRILEILKGWVSQPREEREKSLFWLYAPVAMGKSTIAQTLAEECEVMDNLGASFFFSRLDARRNRAERFVASLALQLALSIRQLKPHIEAAVINNPTILSKSLPVQLQKLVIEPFQKIPRPEEDKTVVIDGLDECEGAKPLKDREREQRLVLELIQRLKEADLPLNIAIFSRPESWIEEAFDELETLSENTERYDLFSAAEKYADVERYLRDHFQRIRKARKHRHAMSQIQDPWPLEDAIQELVRRSSGQFGYVATVIRFVDDPYGNPPERLKLLLRNYPTSHGFSNPMKELDDLYLRILKSCPNREEMMQALGWLMVINMSALRHSKEAGAFVPLYDQVIAGKAGAMAKALRGLHAIVHIPSFITESQGTDEIPLDADSHTLIQQSNPSSVVYHNSFLEFLSNPSRSGTFHCDEAYWAIYAASRCLQFLSSNELADFSDDVLSLAAAFWPRGFFYFSRLPFERTPENIEACRLFATLFLARDLSTDFTCPGEGRTLFFHRSISFSASIFIDQPSIALECLSHWHKAYSDLFDDCMGSLSSEGRLYLERLFGSLYALTLDPSIPHTFEWRCILRQGGWKGSILQFENNDISSVLGEGALGFSRPFAWENLKDPETSMPRILELSPVAAVYGHLPPEFHSFMFPRLHSIHVSPAEVCNRLWDLFVSAATHDWGSANGDDIFYGVCLPLLDGIFGHLVLLDSIDGLYFLVSPSSALPTIRRVGDRDRFYVGDSADKAIIKLIFDKKVEMALAVLNFCEAMERLTLANGTLELGWFMGAHQPLFDEFRSDPYDFISRF